MGGATNRFFTLLSSTTTSPLLFRRRYSSPLLLLRRRSRRRHFLTLSPHASPFSTATLPPIKPSRRPFQSRAATSLHDHDHDHDYDHRHLSPPPSSQPWPEWSRLLDALSAAGYAGRAEVDELAGSAHLPPEFTCAASACLEFARNRAGLVRLLSKRDVEVVVRNGTPFLFKEANNTNVLDMDKVSTVDLMRFILSYASNFIFPSESNNLYNRELVESSVRNLLLEMAKLCYVVPDSNSFDPLQNKFADGNGVHMRPIGQRIEMKRGDWICPRCTFMNFARNMKCLECEEARPKSQLTGGEWECPQCDFFNYGRNTVCLRCDCKRPGQISVSTTSTRLGKGAYENGSNSSEANIDSRLAANEEKAQRWFSKISQLDGTSDMSSAIADEDFPEIMPLRKGVNRFVVSTRKTPSERRLANSQYQTNAGNGNTFEAGSLSNSSSVSPHYGQPGGRNSNYVPFVPLPANMFAQKPENPEAENRGKEFAGSDEFVASNTRERASNAAASDKSRELVQKPLNQAECDVEKEQAEKSDRWFQKVAELHNVTDLASAISDEDFPEIMPMRKGENRFVVSKKKDRSLISPAYKRQMAMEQASNTKFVPFVPFPPDYFAKKDNKPQADRTDLATKNGAETIPNSTMASKLPERLDNARPANLNKDHLHQTDNRGGLQSWNSDPSTGNLSVNKTGGSYELPASGNVSQNSTNPYSNSSDSLGYGGISRKETSKGIPNSTGSSLQPPENQSIRESWTGKSLEGSAVKEPDPLDMSEEAKAERWFRRVAQIKDISELSQIPDEDFPSIMPMRKGVNRFVVSKRKTPLERRLTSPQYRRNLPIVSSDPVKKENDNS